MAGKYKPILCLDFDGVIHQYTTKWTAPDVISDDVVPGFFEWAERASMVFQLGIYSSRSKYAEGIIAIKQWLDVQYEKSGHVWPGYHMAFEYYNEKPPAFLTIDDRAIQFNGDWSSLKYNPVILGEFVPWQRRGTKL